MVALPSAPGVARVVVKQSLGNVNCFNVFHVFGGAPAAWGPTDLAALATAIRSTWVSSFIPLQNPALTLTDVDAVDLTSDTGVGATVTGSNAGSRTGTAAPASAATCLSWKIVQRYRGGHPRTYVAGLTISDASNANTLQASFVTSMLAAANALRTSVAGVITSGGACQLGALSYYKNKAIRPNPLFLNFTGVSVDNRIDSQRRRLGRDR